jgi:hypothetical protein
LNVVSWNWQSKGHYSLFTGANDRKWMLERTKAKVLSIMLWSICTGTLQLAIPFQGKKSMGASEAGDRFQL